MRSFLFDFGFKEFKLLLGEVLFGIQEPLNDSDTLQLSQVFDFLIQFFLVVILCSDKLENLFIVRIRHFGVNHFEVILSECPELQNLVELFLQDGELLLGNGVLQFVDNILPTI